ncbi:MAG: hypothetical protein R3Y33_03375 [Clostridia bacterium]
MFEIKKTEFVNKTFRLEKSLVDNLTLYASKADISLNALVSQCCKYALENIDNKSDKNDSD